MNAPIDLKIAQLTALTIGTPVEGGFFAGYINQADGVYGLVVAPKAAGQFQDIWLDEYEDVPGARSFFNGLANTMAMAEAGSELAQKVRALDIDGCTDFYIPSRDELEILYRAFKPTTSTNHVYRSGENPSSVPVGYPYTTELPAQTIAEPFKADGAEAFEPRWHWSSTQYDSGCAWIQYFGDGNQDYYGKGSGGFCRAVRRFKA